MTRQWHKTSKRMLFAYFMLGGGIFLFTPPSVTGKLQLAYARMFRKPLETGRLVTLAGRPPTEAVDYTKLMTMQQRLRNHVANLQAQLEEAHRQIETLSGLQTVRERDRMSFRLAGIINDPGQAQTDLLINRGAEDGVAVGQFVLGDLSVIGTISYVSARTARVKLITDPKCTIAVRIGETDDGGVMVGRGLGLAVVPQVFAKDPPKTGDPVYARKTPGFPGVPFVTAEVVESKRDLEAPQTWEVIVRPVSDITNLRDVAVVMPGQ
jgi:cell shape-determining protein MreC